MPTTQTYIGVLVIESCYKCKVVFGITNEMYDRCKTHGDSFYCPNGHGQVFTETLQAQLDRVKQSRDYWQNRTMNEQRHSQALRGVITRTKNRIANGVCPCCNRYFKNIHRHIQTKHPKYKADE